MRWDWFGFGCFFGTGGTLRCDDRVQVVRLGYQLGQTDTRVMETTRSSHDDRARSSGKRDAKRWKKKARFRFFSPCLLSAYMEAHERKRVKETLISSR